MMSFTFKDGYVVTTARSGRDAIALCSTEPFDVVLSDGMMPEMDGHQMVQWVAANHPTTREVRDKCSCSPPCQLITKPFPPRKIVSFVEEVLATRGGEDLWQQPASGASTGQSTGCSSSIKLSWRSRVID
jgi:DNA-binding response OmpR family regulator